MRPSFLSGYSNRLFMGRACKFSRSCFYLAEHQHPFVDRFCHFRVMDRRYVDFVRGLQESWKVHRTHVSPQSPGDIYIMNLRKAILNSIRAAGVPCDMPVRYFCETKLHRIFTFYFILENPFGIPERLSRATSERYRVPLSVSLAKLAKIYCRNTSMD